MHKTRSQFSTIEFSEIFDNKSVQSVENLCNLWDGETWVEEEKDKLDKITHKFTSKELDEETGLYYFGARYLDPMTSRWVSGDPILGDYLPVAPINDEEKEHNKKLPGMGGVFNHLNIALYHYAGNNPIKYVDPNGEYGIDVHFYLTEYLAIKAGFSRKHAKEIATACQSVDTNPQTQPFRSVEARAEWHFPVKNIDGRESVVRDSEVANEKVSRAIGNLDAIDFAEFGMSLHVLQDSFSHEGFGPIFGHLHAGHNPDRTYLDVDKSMQMAKVTYNKMIKYLKNRGYKVKDNWDKIAQDVRKKIDEFSRQYNTHDNRQKETNKQNNK